LAVAALVGVQVTHAWKFTRQRRRDPCAVVVAGEIYERDRHRQVEVQRQSTVESTDTFSQHAIVVVNGHDQVDLRRW
jgi:hypothetical protein